MSTAVLMEKVAQVAPDKYAYLVKTAGIIRESPFRDEILGQLDAIVKKANAAMNPTNWQRAGNAAKGIGMAVGTGIAMSLAGDMFDAAKRGVTKSINYRRMMKENPDLADLPARNVQKSFATLHRFNSDFSADPTVAGAFVRKSSMFAEDSFDPQLLKGLVDSKKSLSDGRKLPIPGKLPWESLEEKKFTGQKQQLELERLRQQNDPELQYQMKEPHPTQQNLWESQKGLADRQRQKLMQEQYRSNEGPGRGNKRQNQHRP